MLVVWWVLWVNFCCFAAFDVKQEIDGDNRDKISLKSPGKHLLNVPSKYNRMVVYLAGACGGLNNDGSHFIFLFLQ